MFENFIHYCAAANRFYGKFCCFGEILAIDALNEPNLLAKIIVIRLLQNLSRNFRLKHIGIVVA